MPPRLLVSNRHPTFAHRGWLASATVISILVLQLLVLVPAAHAGVSCSVSNHTATITLSGPGAFIVTVSSNGTNLLVNNSPCGKVGPIGDPQAVDFVSIGGDPSAFGQLTISLAGGPLGPGFTDEPNDSDEIEFEIHGGTTGPQILGSEGDDKIVVGSHLELGGPTIGTVNDINLNGFQDGTAQDGDVEVHGNPSLIWLVGGAGNDILSGGGFDFRPLAGAAAVPMRFYDRPGDDLLIGGGKDDEFRASDDSTGADAYFGGSGFDLLRYDDRYSPHKITQDGEANDGAGCPATCEGDNVGADIELLYGGSGENTWVGAAGRQFFYGGFESDLMNGGPGNDVLSGGSGADDYHGGKGMDIASFRGSFEPTVTVDGKPNDGSTNENDNVRKDVEIVFGSSGTDHLIGNAGRNYLHGGPGNDVLKGMGGDDFLDGGGALPREEAEPDDGSDVFFGGSGTDTVTEADHTGGVIVTFDNLPNDAVIGQSEGSDNVRGDVENVVGTDFDDRLFGSSAANRLVGGKGPDRLTGEEGNDVLVPGPGTDTLKGGPGQDTARYAGAAAAITANLSDGTAEGDGPDTLAGFERLEGSDHDDRLTGSDLVNWLTGGAGDDDLFGRAGADTLNGGANNDVCVGGTGPDTFTSCEAKQQ
jgi:Ca2+-binding RTX toxin-like protein